MRHRRTDLAGRRGGSAPGRKRQSRRVHPGAAEHLLRRRPRRIEQVQGLDDPRLLSSRQRAPRRNWLAGGSRFEAGLRPFLRPPLPPPTPPSRAPPSPPRPPPPPHPPSPPPPSPLP